MPARKDFLRCKSCGRQQPADDPDNGFKVVITTTGSHKISCPCGIMTKLCPTKQHLQSVWNSAPGKPVPLPKVEVKHPKTHHINPDDIPDAF